MTVYIVSGILIVVSLYLIVLHNTLVARKNNVDQAYSSLEVYLKKRYDLIPNLVAIVRKYAQHEKEIMLQVSEIRAGLATSRDADEKIAAGNQMEKLLFNIRLTAENYPDIKADTQFLSLQFSLNDMEEQLAAARRAFNASVTEYNNSIQAFPLSIIAGMKGFQAKALLEIPKQEQQYVALDKLL